VILFVVLPFVLAAVIVPLVSWRWSSLPKPVLTSEILTHGQPAQGEIVSVRNLGNILDLRPMVRFVLHVRVAPDEEAFDLEIVQSLPRAVIGDFRAGDRVDVRLTPDRTRGAVVWAGDPNGTRS
jgi:hypothetical protein